MAAKNNLESYMHQKGQEYRAFEPNVAREIFTKLKPHLDALLKKKGRRFPKTIQIIGTNGKGSTGRFLTLLLGQKYSVLHFTSPHLFKFNERFYKIYTKTPQISSLQTQNVAQNNTTQNNANLAKNGVLSDDELESAHQFLQQFDFMERASYFEYATFLAAILACDVDFFVLECGLGGEFDSTSVLARDLCVFSRIDLDHQEILGNSIEKIARTKLNAMVGENLLGIQGYDEVCQIAREIADSRSVRLFCVESNNVESSTESRKAQSSAIKKYLSKHNLAQFLGENLTLAVEALKILGQNDLADSALLENLPKLDLLGRCEKIAHNIIIDVGHNLSGALAIKREIKDKKLILVYNSFFQKNVREILRVLRENILRVEIISVENPRIIPRLELEMILDELGIEYSDFRGVSEEGEYLVFGSFSVVEAFLRQTKWIQI